MIPLKCKIKLIPIEEKDIFNWSLSLGGEGWTVKEQVTEIAIIVAIFWEG